MIETRKALETIAVAVLGTALCAGAGYFIDKVSMKVNAKMNADVRTSYAQESMDRSAKRSADALERMAAASERNATANEARLAWDQSRCLPRPSVLDEGRH